MSEQYIWNIYTKDQNKNPETRIRFAMTHTRVILATVYSCKLSFYRVII